MRFVALALVLCVAIPSTVGGVMIWAVLARDPADPPIAVRIPDLAFYIPGTQALVKWEARRDAKQQARQHHFWLLGYLHGSNVGDLNECMSQGYQDRAGRSQDVPTWTKDAILGKLTVACGESKSCSAYEVTVVECGNPTQTHQVVYGRSFNAEMLRVMKSNSESGGEAGQSAGEAPVR